MAVGNEDQIKFVIGGFIGGAQSWSTGIWSGVSTTGTPTGVDLNNALTTWFAQADNMWTTLKARNAATVTRQFCAAYFYPSGANVASLVAHQTVTSSAGTGTNYSSPRQALVVALTSGMSGRSYRGRMYLPFTGIASAANLQAQSADVDAITGAVATLCTAMKSMSLGGPWGNCPPRIRSNKLGQGIIVTGVSGNSLIDTQRRREDKLAVAYTKVLTV